MEILTALARHQHFSQAADECGISQPAFSVRIRNLEASLGIAIVNRGNRFQGFTPEGQIVLRWAHRIVQDADGLRQEVTAARGLLSGRLAIGVIPTALAFAARAPALIREAHPDLMVEIRAASSDEIRRGLGDFSIGAGISYVDDPLDKAVITEVLYQEEYLLVTAPGLTDETTQISWADAATLPLCLLSRSMQNRRIIDGVFGGLGVAPHAVMETNSLTAALVQLESGTAATIVPRQLVNDVPLAKGLKVLELVSPKIRRPVGLLLPDREPSPPAHKVLADVLRKLSR